MSPFRRRRSFSRVPRVRRRNAWLGDAGTGAIVNGTGSVTVLTTGELFDQSTEPTVARIRGHLYLNAGRNVKYVTAGGRVDLTLGLMICNPSLPAYGPAASPEDEAWLWIGFMWWGFDDFYEKVWDGTQASWNQSSWFRPTVRDYLDVDVRAKRKVQDPGELRLCWDAVVSGDVTNVQLRRLLRALVLE